jgi:hypothetical protein
VRVDVGVKVAVALGDRLACEVPKPAPLPFGVGDGIGVADSIVSLGVERSGAAGDSVRLEDISTLLSRVSAATVGENDGVGSWVWVAVGVSVGKTIRVGRTKLGSSAGAQPFTIMIAQIAAITSLFVRNPIRVSSLFNR